MNLWLLFALSSAFVMLVIFPLYTGNALRGYPVIRIIVKGCGAFIAAGLALYGALRFPDTAAWFIVSGLAVCAMADMALQSHFMAGMGIFLAGHILYLCAYRNLAPFHSASLVIFTVLFAAVVGLFYDDIPKIKGRKLPYFLYGAVLMLMLSVSLPLPLYAGARGIAAATGAALFVMSDFTLAKSLIKDKTGTQNYIVMFLYYSAQLILSLVALRPWLS